MIALRNNGVYVGSFVVMADVERRLWSIRVRAGMGDGTERAKTTARSSEFSTPAQVTRSANAVV